MRAALFRSYGSPDGIVPGELPTPEPKPGQVRVRIVRATVTAGDSEMRRLRLPLWVRIPMRAYVGLFRPKRVRVLGMEFAGTVDKIGEGVTRFAVGDSVFGPTGFGFGGYAEYVCLSQDAVVARKPEAVEFDDVAALPIGGVEARFFVRKAGLSSSDRVLIYGASGSIGTFTVQLAKLSGATVHAVCGPGSLDLVRSLGADEVYDYTDTVADWRRATYDVFIDTVGKGRFGESIRRVRPGGRYLRTNPTMSHLLGGLFVRLFGRRSISFGSAGESVDDLEYLAGLVAEGRLRTVVDRRYDLDAVAEAHAYVDAGRKVGNVLVDVSSS